jgi:adenosylcobinamide hydrolase
MIHGIETELVQREGNEYLSLRSATPLYVLNSSVWGSGFGWRRAIVNRQVGLDYHCGDPAREMGLFLLEHGFDPPDTAGMLTAARVRDVGAAFHSFSQEGVLSSRGDEAYSQRTGEAAGDTVLDTNGDQELTIGSWVTVGLNNRARAGVTENPAALYPGTINTIVVADAALSEAAMIGAVITATEAKAAALQDLGVTDPFSGKSATGTTTDAVIIGATMRGVRCEYAGTATRLGYLVGRTVYEAVFASGSRYLEQRKTSATVARP